LASPIKGPNLKIVLQRTINIQIKFNILCKIELILVRNKLHLEQNFVHRIQKILAKSENKMHVEYHIKKKQKVSAIQEQKIGSSKLDISY
jgi:hypothetical protein